MAIRPSVIAMAISTLPPLSPIYKAANKRNGASVFKISLSSFIFKEKWYNKGADREASPYPWGLLTPLLVGLRAFVSLFAVLDLP